jgi:hypothetical protein
MKYIFMSFMYKISNKSKAYSNTYVKPPILKFGIDFGDYF